MRVIERARGASRPVLVEIFAIGNLAFLTLDVFIAHSINAFHYPIERIPVAFGAIGALILLAGLAVDAFDLRGKAARRAGYLVGGLSILVGVVGLFLHLRSTFFDQQTLANLVYTAPFAAPLSFAGLGFLVLVNRMVPHGSRAWGEWVLFLAWGGFVGNLALSLADHAQNGFFDTREWIPVFSAAFATAFLFVILVRPTDRTLLQASLFLMALQAGVGVLGFVYHLRADLREPGVDFFQDILFGAPPFAPLLFADLAALAALALWDVMVKTAPAGSASGGVVLVREQQGRRRSRL